jgi:peptidoglycan/xylan/chitin deacetylase (PgdA/CDA1 family)
MKISLVAFMFFALFGLHPAGADEKIVAAAERPGTIQVPILVYHRFGPTVADNMTVTTAVFASQLQILQEEGYTVIPLGQLVDALLGQGPPPPPRSVVITVDDGHRSVYTELFPLVKKFRIPVTLFIYPSAISNAAYAMTWEQLKEMQQSGFCDVQSHTYWHPNFKKDRKQMAPAEYEKAVETQLKKSKARLEKEFGKRVDILAWPFGIYDDWLIGKAAEAGYRAALTLERHPAGDQDKLLALPRYLMLDTDRAERFKRILAVTPVHKFAGAP